MSLNDVISNCSSSSGAAVDCADSLPVTSVGVSPRPEACRVYEFVIEAVLMGVLCLFGVAGNILSMVVLWKDKSKSSTPFLLVSLGGADTLFLAVVFPLRVLLSIHYFSNVRHMSMFCSLVTQT